MAGTADAPNNPKHGCVPAAGLILLGTFVLTAKFPVGRFKGAGAEEPVPRRRGAGTPTHALVRPGPGATLTLGVQRTGVQLRTRPEAPASRFTGRRPTMTVSTILLIIVILLLIGAVPAWPHSRSWGYGPSGLLGLVLVVLIVLLLLGRL